MSEVAVSALPRPRKTKLSPGQDDEELRPQAALLYPALKRSADAGLSWVECFAVMGADCQVGRLIVWMRTKGVVITAFYEAGETRFRLG